RSWSSGISVGSVRACLLLVRSGQWSFSPSFYPNSTPRARLRLPRRPALVALAEHLLVELADARLGYRVDDLDGVGQRPPGELRAQEVDDLAELQGAARLGHHAGQRALDPLRVRDGDDRCLQPLRMAHAELFDVDARHPLAPRLDQVLGPVGDLDVALRVDRGDVPGAEPPVRRAPVAGPGVVVVGRDHPGPAHLQLAHALAVPREL